MAAGHRMKCQTGESSQYRALQRSEDPLTYTPLSLQLITYLGMYEEDKNRNTQKDQRMKSLKLTIGHKLFIFLFSQCEIYTNSSLPGN